MRLLCAAAAAAVLSGCGYVGEPLYPLLNIPVPVKDLGAIERGASIVYQFTVPQLTTEGKQAKIGQIELRIGESGPDWLARSVRVEAAADPSGHVRGAIPVTAWIGKQTTLAVKIYGPNQRDAGWSNLVAVTVIPPLDKPAGVISEAVAEGVHLAWQGQPGQYKVFRKVGDATDYAPAATVATTQWVDPLTEYGKRYSYLLQQVRAAGASTAESDLSDPIEITPVDKFPPAVPTGLNAIAAVDHIELVWDRSTEADSAGYRLYRALAGAAAEKIADVTDAPSYSDRKIEAGKQYRYTVSAVDRLGNESGQSEPAEIGSP